MKMLIRLESGNIVPGVFTVVIYEAFVEGRLEAPKHLARNVHDLYFEPKLRGIPAANDLESL